MSHSHEQVLAKALAKNLSRCVPPLDYEEVVEQVESAERYRGNKKQHKEEIIMIKVEKEIKKLNAVKGNVRAIQKKMKHVHNAARAAGKIHQWRATELQELVDKFIERIEEEIVTLEKSSTNK